MNYGKHYHSTVQHALEPLLYRMMVFQAYWTDSTVWIFFKEDDDYVWRLAV
jgi:hypothetical protein